MASNGATTQKAVVAAGAAGVDGKGGEKDVARAAGCSLRAADRAGSEAGAWVPPFRRQAGKELATGGEGTKKKALVINMSGARQHLNKRFLAVGLFLSVLLVSSRDLIDHMKKVWKLRGHLYDTQFEAAEGRKFVFEFTEEGDRRHVVRGGPWQYRGDVFLVEELEAGAAPSSVLFTHVPMWVQFRSIPPYLLTKTLARNLGDEIGTTVMIDNNARGDINDKFIRTRVQLPLYTALQKEITLADEITGEEIDVCIRYERLPNFCVLCGFIGHMEARCDLPAEGRKISFSKELGVPAVHFADPRCWYLPDAMGQAQHQQPAAAPWRASRPSGLNVEPDVPAQLSTIAQVADDVARLTMGNDKDFDNNTNANVPDKNEAMDTMASNIEAEARDTLKTTVPAEADAAANQIAQVEKNITLEPAPTTASSNAKKNKSWRRQPRGDPEVQSVPNSGSASPALKEAKGAGTVRQRSEESLEDTNTEPATKRSSFRAPTLSECLGKEGLRKLQEAEIEANQHVANNEEDAGDRSQEGNESAGESTGGTEAAGHGATGKLPGASESARQGPCVSSLGTVVAWGSHEQFRSSLGLSELFAPIWCSSQKLDKIRNWLKMSVCGWVLVVVFLLQ